MPGYWYWSSHGEEMPTQYENHNIGSSMNE